ncbi:hypothetical protein [Limisalsivibrio acetivorans]|uniref:hypothetical protein n=1 Tax=Limisalsivibrio acetivorans TaxID=1304888 RepID=UPI0003B51253|nr:hypothetical protein [Limisalsivibrio acetivorans]
MKRKAFTAVVVAVLLAMAVSTAFAANARKGKRTWKKSCRTTCHDGSKAVELSPVSKTQAQWKRFFDNAHAEIDEAHAGVEVDALKDSDWADMFEYLHGHALDSDQPETCG